MAPRTPGSDCWTPGSSHPGLGSGPSPDPPLISWLASAEEEALARVLRSLPGAAPNAEFLEAWGSLPDPERLLDLARSHALLGPLQGALLDAGLLPDAGLAYAEAKLRHAWTRAALDEASAALDDAKVAHVVLKGPLLAEALYPTPGQRSSLDLDLLVAPADLDAALAALVRLDYLAQAGPGARYARAHHVHLHLVRADRPLIELHFRAFRGFGIELQAAPLLTRSRPAPGSSARVLEPHDRFLYLALHAAGHLFERLGWLYDLKLLLAAEDLDPALIAARAEALGAGPALALACAALEELRPQAESLTRLQGLLPAPRRLQAAARLRQAHQRGLRDSPRATLERIAFQTLLAPDANSGARFLAHHLARITRRRLQRFVPALIPAEWSG